MIKARIKNEISILEIKRLSHKNRELEEKIQELTKGKNNFIKPNFTDETILKLNVHYFLLRIKVLILQNHTN